jgi:hypothetical protein
MSPDLQHTDVEHRGRRLYSALDRLPRSLRLALIASSVIRDVPGATTACAALISLATCMAARLNAQQREAVARHMFLEGRSLVETGDGVDDLRLN